MSAFHVKEPSVQSAADTAAGGGHCRIWARRRQPKAAVKSASGEATEKVGRLAEAKVEYYKEKMTMKRQQHELWIKEHEKRVKLLDIQETYYNAKLHKLAEE